MTTKKVRAPKSTAKQEKRANGQGSIYFDHKKNRYIVAVPKSTRMLLGIRCSEKKE